MSIVKGTHTKSKLRRSVMSPSGARLRRAINIPLLRGLQPFPESAVHRYPGPTGLVILAFGVVVVCAISDSRVSALAIPETNRSGPQESAPNYSKFKHDNPNHSRLPCLLCHRRETNSPRPTMPGSNGHLPCAGCHAQQFKNSADPICTICHTDAQSGKVKPFPRLSSFNMKFDHARHMRMGGGGCVTCHRPSRAGVAMTIPAGLNAHATCYQCHSPRAMSGAQANGRDISSCGTCHQPGRYVRTRETAPAFRLGFSHAKHGKPEGLSCNECHRVRAGVAQRLQVTAPQPLNHHAAPGALSCMSCHNGKRAFGGDDFSACKRCHTRPTWHF
jgi:c(7)-type cytochrome triheme protein